MCFDILPNSKWFGYIHSFRIFKAKGKYNLLQLYDLVFVILCLHMAYLNEEARLNSKQPSYTQLKTEPNNDGVKQS